MKTHEFTDPVFGVAVCICVGKLEDLRPFFEQRHPEGNPWSDLSLRDSEGKTIVYEEPNSSLRHFYIWLPDWTDHPAQLGILVHECTHVALSGLRNARVYSTEETDEVFCYFVEYVFNQALGFLSPAKRKRR